MTKQEAKLVAIDTQEALRLLEAMHEATRMAFPTVFHPPTNYVAAHEQLRALLSAKEGEPSRDQWLRAFALEQGTSVFAMGTFERLEQRAIALRDAEKEKGNG